MKRKEVLKRYKLPNSTQEKILNPNIPSSIEDNQVVINDFSIKTTLSPNVFTGDCHESFKGE